MELDHILWAAPDLDRAAEQFASISGVEPSVGGSHPGFGTRNKLVSMGEGLFFEIIAPDPLQTDRGVRAEAILALAAPEMHAFCLRSDDLAGVAERGRTAGITIDDPVPMSRTRPDGVKLNWEILYLRDPEWGDALPFLIDWKGSPHPAITASGGIALGTFTVLHPEAQALAALYGELGIEVAVAGAPCPGFLLQLDTPRGEVVLT